MAGSGSRAHKVSIHPGDIGPIKNLNKRFPFCIECRAREIWDIDRVFKVPKPEILTWFLKNCQDAGDEYLSLLIAKKNFHTPVVVHPPWQSLKRVVSGVELHLTLTNTPVLDITPLDAFFEAYPTHVFVDTSPDSQMFLDMKRQEKTAVQDITFYLERS